MIESDTRNYFQKLNGLPIQDRPIDYFSDDELEEFLVNETIENEGPKELNFDNQGG